VLGHLHRLRQAWVTYSLSDSNNVERLPVSARAMIHIPGATKINVKHEASSKIVREIVRLKEFQGYER
jgi:hypothetical protein